MQMKHMFKISKGFYYKILRLGLYISYNKSKRWIWLSKNTVWASAIITRPLVPRKYRTLPAQRLTTCLNCGAILSTKTVTSSTTLRFVLSSWRLWTRMGQVNLVAIPHWPRTRSWCWIRMRVRREIAAATATTRQSWTSTLCFTKLPTVKNTLARRRVPNKN